MGMTPYDVTAENPVHARRRHLLQSRSFRHHGWAADQSNRAQAHESDNAANEALLLFACGNRA
jgi:hypothetical protein